MILHQSPLDTHIIRKAQHDLRCPIPSSRNILRHEPLTSTSLSLLRTTARCISSRQAEIAYFQLAVGVNEQIARFEVTMEDVSRVDVFEAAESLVQEGLEMCVGERLTRTDLKDSQ